MYLMGDIFEEKVQGYEELIEAIEAKSIAAVTNPNFELFLLLHIEGSYERYIKDHEADLLKTDEKGKYSHAYHILRELTGMNAKKNPEIGNLAEKVLVAIEQEKQINQDIYQLKGKVSSNVGAIIETILNEKPEV